MKPLKCSQRTQATALVLNLMVLSLAMPAFAQAPGTTPATPAETRPVITERHDRHWGNWGLLGLLGLGGLLGLWRRPEARVHDRNAPRS